MPKTHITSLGLTAATCGASIKGLGGPPEVEPIAPGEPEPLPEPEPAGCCFAAGTPVHTDHGDVPVEKIKVGDRVLSHSSGTAGNEFEPVTALTPPHLDKLVELQIAGEQNVLHPSEHHPFWVKRSEGDPGHWIEAANLRVGELLETTEGKWRKIDSVTQLNREETVYNFTVANDHDYFVGQTGFLVHNKNCGCWPDNPLDMDTILGIAGEFVPDVPGAPGPPTFGTPGRNKWKWKLPNGKTLRFESHNYPPYCNGGPRETNPHWQINGVPGKWFPGDPIPPGLW